MQERFSKRLATIAFVLSFAVGNLHSPCALADASDSAATWVPTGNLNFARSGHTATLLPNGKVLVAGGGDGNGIVRDSAEVYDPVNGTWTLTGPLNAPRAGHTATLLPSGQVLVVGGVNLQNDVIAELYNPDTNTWTRTGTPSANRFDHTATLLQNGEVLVAGGAYAGYVSTAELYGPATGAWRYTGRLIGERALHQATLLQDGRVLVTGGSNDADYAFALNTAELYDPVTGTWSSSATLNSTRHSHMATLLPSGKVLVGGGYGGFADDPPGCFSRPTIGVPCSYGAVLTNSAELYDPASDRWSKTGSLKSGRYGGTATLLSNGKVLVAGGAGVVDLTSAEIYDEDRGAWDYTSALNTRRWGHTATLLRDGKVLIAGGIGEGSALTSAELYEPAPGPVVVGTGFTGSWYDPAQSGHGVTLEVLAGPPQQLLAYWFTFAPQGGQSWIAALGPFDGNRAVLQGVQTVGAGARFPPNFNAANTHQESWGTLTFTFSDCNHGRVDWSSTVPGYSSGGMDLTRLTLPAGLTCSP